MESFELGRVGDGAEFGDVERAVRVEFHAQHVVNAHAGNNGAGVPIRVEVPIYLDGREISRALGKVVAQSDRTGAR